MPSGDRALPATLGARLLRVALRTFPPTFRERYTGEMMDTLVDMIDDTRRHRGSRAAFALMFSTLGNVLRTGVAERVAARRRAHTTPRPHSELVPRETHRMSALLTDLRFAVRSLVRRPAFALVAIGTLAVGIGSSAAMFSLANGIAFQPLPYPEPDRLVRVWDTFVRDNAMSGSSSPANYRDWRQQQRSFTALAAYNNTELAYTGIEPAESFVSAEISAGFTEVLGIRPVLGRAFTTSDETFGNHRVVLVSHAFWERYLGSDAGVVGRSLPINGVPYVVAGVMPRDFAFPTRDTQLWVPMAFDFDVSTSRGVHYISVIGRLAPGVTLDGASAEMSTLMNRLVSQYPDRLDGWGVRLESLHTSIVGDVTSRLEIFLAAVALLLLIAVVNVANLMLAQALTRFRELAVRSAMGAGKWRLVRQLAAEATVIAGVAGALGIAVAAGITRAVVHFAPTSTPRLDSVGIDLTTVAFAALVSIAVAAMVSAWPAFRVARRDLVGTLKEGSRGTSGGRGARSMRHAFLVAQLSLAVVLAIGATLLMKSFERLAAVDPGYGADDALVVTINTPASRYPEPPSRARFFVNLTERLGQLPGVTAAAASTQLPLEGWGISFTFWPEGTDLPEKDRPSGDFRSVTPGYFEAMEIPLRSGRVFTRADDAGSPPVIVIEESLARAHFGNQDPIGRRIYVGYGGGRVAREIVGVVGAVRQRALDVDAAPGYYVPVTQIPWSTMRVVVRTTRDPLSLSDAVKREVAAIDPLIAVRQVTTLSERFDRSVGSQRFTMLLLGSFAALAVLLATAGVYSVMSHIVAQLSRDIGVRMALGARASEVRRSVSLRALRVAAVGAAIGLAIAIALTPRMAALLFQVQARDPVAFAVAPLLLLLVALLGSYVPARRASNVDPIVALRNE